MYSSPRWQCDRIAQRLLWVPVGTNSAASKPSIPAIFSCSAFTLGSSPNTSSPSGAAIIAARMPGVGCVTVSLRRSTTVAIIMPPDEPPLGWHAPPRGAENERERGGSFAVLQEVLEHGVAMLGEDRFGMELHALDGQLLVAHPHDFAVFSPGRGNQVSRARGLLDGQRVIAVDGEFFGQPGKDAFARRRDDAGLAVHELLRTHDLAAECCPHGLVPEAHAQDRQLAGEMADGVDRNARFGRRAGTRRHHQVIWVALRNAFDGDLVIAKHFDLRAELAEVLHQVVGEAVVVVDHEELHVALLLDDWHAADLLNAEGAEVTQSAQRREFIACSPCDARPSRGEMHGS